MGIYSSNSVGTIRRQFGLEGDSLRRHGFKEPDLSAAPEGWDELTPTTPAYKELPAPHLAQYQEYLAIGEIALEG